ncbi:MAG: chromosomal replication initiator protein DnaA [Oscillospiraceae bacterium]|nr:chromosomal replication initiator protein DnaA [Oscillospiraceae bacterium]
MNSFDEVYESVLDYIKKKTESAEISTTAYNTWIKDKIMAEKMEGSTVYLSVENDWLKGIIEKNYKDLLKEAFTNVMGFEPEINIITKNHQDIPSEVNDPALEKAFSNAEYEYTFETFIVGKSNQFAHAASVAVAQNPGADITYNPLFIHGPSGLGKTHLLQAIGNKVKSLRPECNVIYVTSEVFTTELIDAIRRNDPISFKDKYRSADVLLVDDVQFIAGKESTQEEFFNTFNILHSERKQIVLTSDRPPKEIKRLEERIKSRFEQGLIADIGIPDYETRVAIVKRKALLLDIELSDDIINYIATRLKTNVRQLEGCVKKLKAYKHLMKTSPTLTQAQSAISEILSDSDNAPISAEKIISEVAAIYGVKTDDIRSEKRSKQISLARKVCAYVIKEMTPLSLKSIGSELGNKDHSSVSGYINDIKKLMTENDVIRDNVEDIIRNIKSQNPSDN